MLLPNRHGSIDTYRYGFQGQEKDDEVKGEGNSINYKFRMHDPRVGRFFAVDPLAYKYSFNSPYAFSENNVIHAVELEGREKDLAFFDKVIEQKQDEFEQLSEEEREANKESLLTFGKGYAKGLGDVVNPVEWVKGGWGMLEFSVKSPVEKSVIVAQGVINVKQIHQNGDDEAVGRFYGNIVGGFFLARVAPKIRISKVHSSIPKFIPLDKIKITSSGLEKVKAHLAKFEKDAPGGQWEHNRIMIERQQKIIDGELDATNTDKLFYSHELRESQIMDKLIKDGMPFDEAYKKAHNQAAKEYNVNPDGRDFYTKDANDAFDKQLIDEADGKYD